MVLCLGEPPRRFLLLLYLNFHFWSSFHFFVVSSFVDFLPSHFICFSTSSLILPRTIAGFLHLFYTFSSVHRRVIRDTFIFNFSVIFLLWVLRFWVGISYPQTFFTLHSFTDIFYLRLSRLPWELAVLPWSLQGFITDPRNTDPAHLFVWFTVNSQSTYSERFSFKFYHILAWITCGEKFRPYLFRTLVACSKSYVKTIWTRLDMYRLQPLQMNIKVHRK